MNRLPRFAILACALAASLCFAVRAQSVTLYAATNLRYADAKGIAGRLYIIDPATAAAKLVGPIRLPENRTVGVTGLAIHPRSGVLYGITAGLTPDMRPSLVTIDRRSGDAKIVGTLGAPGSDINFGLDARLYMWLSDTNQLGVVDPATGAVARLGEPRDPRSGGGGLAINDSGVAFATDTTAGDSLDLVDVKTGAIRQGPSLSGAPYLSAINSMTFSPKGVLYAVNTNGSIPARASLVTIDTGSGRVSVVGALPDDIDGIAFSPDAAGAAAFPRSLELLGIALAVLSAVGLLWIALRRRPSPS